MLIDLAFLGLSTITREGRSPLGDGSEFLSDFCRTALLARDAFGAAVRLAAGFFDPVSSAGGVVCLDLRATVLSYLSCSQKTACVDPHPCRTDDLERVIEIVLFVRSCYDEIEGRLRLNPATFP